MHWINKDDSKRIRASGFCEENLPPPCWCIFVFREYEIDYLLGLCPEKLTNERLGLA